MHFEQLPAREPRYREPGQPLSAAARRALAARGISRLFEHQAQVGVLSCTGKTLQWFESLTINEQ